VHRRKEEEKERAKKNPTRSLWAFLSWIVWFSRDTIKKRVELKCQLFTGLDLNSGFYKFSKEQVSLRFTGQISAPRATQANVRARYLLLYPLMLKSI
jgi:hypothetical protein